jgi:hypothetical protein
MSSTISRVREVLVCSALAPLVCLGDLGRGFLDVDGGFSLDLVDFGLWLWIWLQLGRLVLDVDGGFPLYLRWILGDFV